MSRLFDALQRPETERSGITSLNLSSLSVASTGAAETEQCLDTITHKALTCPSCKFTTPDNSLFCPNCNAFLGSVETKSESGIDSEPQRSIQGSASRSTRIRLLWSRARRLMTLGFILVLTILLY